MDLSKRYPSPWEQRSPGWDIGCIFFYPHNPRLDVLTAKYYDPDIETASRERIDRIQSKRLLWALSRARRSPLYRARLAEKESLPAPHSAGDLAQLVFTTKEDLRRAYPFGALAVDLRRIVSLRRTSGMSGQPVVVTLRKQVYVFLEGYVGDAQAVSGEDSLLLAVDVDKVGCHR
jgi:hypothetical protein